MGVLGYRCPASGEDVTTAIETSTDTLVRMRKMDLSIWVWCPHCIAGHQIKPSEAVLQDESHARIDTRAQTGLQPAMPTEAPDEQQDDVPAEIGPPLETD